MAADHPTPATPDPEETADVGRPDDETTVDGGRSAEETADAGPARDELTADGAPVEIEETAGAAPPEVEATRAAETPGPEASGGAPPRIEGYALERELGRGGVGIVYVARDERLDRRVAIKVLRAGELANDAQLARFRLEARAASRLKHPGVVGIHEVGEQGRLSYLVMDLIEGESLAERLRREGTLDGREAARIVAKLARALHAAHAQAILHRDVKPSNVLLDEAGEPFLGDFGLAKEIESEEGVTVTGDVVGTPAYMAPEQATASGAAVGRWTDVYGLGATLYALVCGRPPFGGDAVLEVIRQVAEVEPTPPRRLRPDLDRDLETVCLKCLEKDPTRRYSSAAELADDLEAYLSHRSVAARPPTVVDRLGKWLRRNRRVASAAGVVALFALLLLAAGGVWFTLRLQTALQTAEANAQRAEQEAERAKAAEARANREAKAALDRATIAVEALSTLIVEAQMELDKVPGTAAKRVREKLISEAAGHLERLRATRVGGATIHQLDAETQRRIGDALYAAGRNAEAQTAYEDALAKVRAVDAPPEETLGQVALYLDSLGRVREELGDLPGARAHYEEALAIRRAASEEHPDNLIALRNLAVSLDKIASVTLLQGDAAGARPIFEEWLGICRRLEKEEPDEPRRRYETTFALTGLGSFLEAQGDYPEALQRYREAIAILREHLEQEPTDVEARVDLATHLTSVGDMLRLKHEGTKARAAYEGAITELLRAREQDPGRSVDWPLARANSLLATILRERGELGEAKRVARAAAEVFERLRRDMPESPTAGLGAVGAHLQAGDLAAAAGELDAAGASYAKAEETILALQKRDPTNAMVETNLSVILLRRSMFALSRGETQAAEERLTRLAELMVRLRARDPANSQHLAVTDRVHKQLGKLHEAKGDLPAAVASYRAGAAAARAFFVASPTHPNAEDRVCNSLYDVGRVLRAQGKPAEALPVYEEAVAHIRSCIAVENPQPIMFRNLSIYLSEESTCRLELGDHETAVERALEALLHHGEVSKRQKDKLHEVPIMSWRLVMAAATGAANDPDPKVRETLRAKGLKFLQLHLDVRRMELNTIRSRLKHDPPDAERKRLQGMEAEVQDMIEKVRTNPKLKPLHGETFEKLFKK